MEFAIFYSYFSIRNTYGKRKSYPIGPEKSRPFTMLIHAVIGKYKIPTVQYLPRLQVELGQVLLREKNSHKTTTDFRMKSYSSFPEITFFFQ